MGAAGLVFGTPAASGASTKRPRSAPVSTDSRRGRAAFAIVHHAAAFLPQLVLGAFGRQAGLRPGSLAELGDRASPNGVEREAGFCDNGHGGRPGGGDEVPYCGERQDRVVDSARCATDGSSAAPECLGCQRRFTSYETIEEVSSGRQRDGRRETFDRKKLLSGLLRRARSDPSDPGLEEIVLDVENRSTTASSARSRPVRSDP